MMSKQQEQEKALRVLTRQALEVAARSLRTAAEWQDRKDRTPEELWPYLRVRADAAERALHAYVNLETSVAGERRSP